MVNCVLVKLGFTADDFDLIIGWQEPETFPVKWTCSPVIFEKIIKQFNCKPGESLAVGDDWSTDLLPAKTLGIKTAQIGKHNSEADFHFDNIQEFLKQINTKT